MEASSYRLISLHHILLRQSFTKSFWKLSPGFAGRLYSPERAPEPPLPITLCPARTLLRHPGNFPTLLPKPLRSPKKKRKKAFYGGWDPSPGCPPRSAPPPPSAPRSAVPCGSGRGFAPLPPAVPVTAAAAAWKVAASAAVQHGQIFLLAREDARWSASVAASLGGGQCHAPAQPNKKTVHSLVIPTHIALAVGRLRIIN